MSLLKDFWHNQWVSHGGVEPMHRFDPARGIFWLNTPAGVIKWRVRNKRMDKFRNEFVNEIDALAKRKSKGEDITRDAFRIYRKIRGEYQVSYSANARTRLRGLSEWILSVLASKTS